MKLQCSRKCNPPEKYKKHWRVTTYPVIINQSCLRAAPCTPTRTQSHLITRPYERTPPAPHPRISSLRNLYLETPTSPTPHIPAPRDTLRFVLLLLCGTALFGVQTLRGEDLVVVARRASAAKPMADSGQLAFLKYGTDRLSRTRLQQQWVPSRSSDVLLCMPPCITYPKPHPAYE